MEDTVVIKQRGAESEKVAQTEGEVNPKTAGKKPEIKLVYHRNRDLQLTELEREEKQELVKAKVGKTRVTEADRARELRQKEKKVKKGKELRSLLGISGDDPMLIEQKLSNSGVAERIINRRRKSVTERIEKDRMKKLEKKKKKVNQRETVIISDDSEESWEEDKKVEGSKNQRIKEERMDSDDDYEVEMVKETQEKEEVVGKEEGSSTKKRNPRLTVEEAMEFGAKIGVNKTALKNNEEIKKAIAGILEEAEAAGIKMEEEETEKARFLEEENGGKFRWADYTSEEEDWSGSDGEGDDLLCD